VTVNRYAVIVFWSEDDGAWVADVPDLKSCAAVGSTPEEAVAEVRIAMDAWLAAARDAGLEIPKARYQPGHEAAE
jgi:predicted RNase H-like HicB family nuclease